MRRVDGSHGCVSQFSSVRIPVWLLLPPRISLSSSAERDQGAGRSQLHGVVLNLFPILVALRRTLLFFDVPQFMAAWSTTPTISALMLRAGGTASTGAADCCTGGFC
jgi:hypothetical protein